LTNVTDVTQRTPIQGKSDATAEVDEKPASRQTSTIGFSTDNDFSSFGPLTIQV
jgi:hypothetical protein